MESHLAKIVKHLRSIKGLTQEQAGDSIHVSGSLIGMIETSRRIPQPDVAQQLDALFGTGDLITEMATEARQSVPPKWFRPWREIEQTATSLRCYQQGIIPGLLQTESYARAALASGLLTPNSVEEHVAIRMERQEILDREEPPLTTFVIDEAALRRGDPVIMKDQLAHLVEMSFRPRVLIHVVPLNAGLYIGQSGPFTIAATDGGENVAFLEDQLQGRVISDLKQVAALERAWDAVRAVALPRDQSRELISKLVDEL